MGDNQSNELRQTLLEFQEQRLQAHEARLSRIQSANEAFTIGATRYWRYRGQCWQAGPDGEPHEIPCDKYYALQGKSTLPPKPFKNKPQSQSSPAAHKQSPRISPDRIKQVASQESFEVKAGKKKIHLDVTPSSREYATQALKNIGIDPVVVSERLLSGIADTAQFTRGYVTYSPKQISLRYRNDLDSEVKFDRQFIMKDDGELVVYHDAFFLPKSNQKVGNAVNMMKYALPVYDELGVSKITITAADVGKYAWLKCGFTPYKDDITYAFVRLLKKSLSRLEADFPTISKDATQRISRILDRISENPRAAWELVDTNDKMPDSEQTVANYLITNTSGCWCGDFDMTDPVTRKRCQEYIDGKFDDYSNYSLDLSFDL